MTNQQDINNRESISVPYPVRSLSGALRALDQWFQMNDSANLDKALDICKELLQSAACKYMEISGAHSEPVNLESAGEQSFYHDVVLPWAMKKTVEAQSLLIFNQWDDALHEEIDLSSKESFAPILCVPLVQAGAVVAIIGVSGKSEGYDSVDVELLQVYGMILFEKIYNRRIHRHLEEVELRFRYSFEQAAAGICMTDSHGVILDVNPKLCEILDYTKDELVGKTVESLTHPEDWPLDQEQKDALYGGCIDSFAMEKRYLRKCGEPVWVKLTASLIKDSSKQFGHFIGIIEDISTQKSVESELEGYRNHLESLVQQRTAALESANEMLEREVQERRMYQDDINLFFNTTLDMLSIAGEDGYFKRMSPTWTTVLGWTEEELCQHPVIHFVHEDDVASTREAMQILLHGGEVLGFQNRLRTKDGNYKWIEWNSYGVPERKLIIAAARDITEKMQNVRILEAAKAEAERAYGDLSRRTWELKTLYDISQIVSESLELEELSKNILRSVEKYLSADGVAIYLYKTIEDQLILQQQLGHSERLLELVSIMSSSERLAGRVVRSKAVVVINSEDHPDPEIRKELLRLGYDRLVGIPMVSGNQSVGAIIVNYRSDNPFDIRQRQLLKAIGVQFATALRNSRLYSDIMEELAERKRLEILQQDTLDALEAERDFVTRMMEIIPNAIVVIDREGNITFANRAAEAVLGIQQAPNQYRKYNAAEWKHTTVEGEPFPEEKQPFVQIMKTKRPVFGIQQAIHRPDGTRVILSINGTPHLNNSGDVEWAIFSMQDITDWFEYQTELKTSRDAANQAWEEAEAANKAKSEFLANMSHEIRTPLNAVIGFSELLRKTVNDSKVQSHVEAIYVAGKSLLRLINDILDLSKIEAGMLELQLTSVAPSMLFSEIRQVFKQSIEARGLNFEMIIDESLPKHLLLDELRMRQVLFNLVGNAVKFTHDGKITLGLRKIREAELPSGHHHIEFYVEDTGIGIAESDIERIFESFIQQSGQSNRVYEGTGLGLTISRKLVEMMHGTIEVKSQVGVGSRFNIRIPDVASADSLDVESPHFDGNLWWTQYGYSVLVAESDPLILKLTTELLREMGIWTFECSSELEAQWLILEKAPDLILLNPEILKGTLPDFWAAVQGRSFKGKIPVVALVKALDNPSNQEGYQDRLEKPVLIESLYKILDENLPKVSENQEQMESRKVADGITPIQEKRIREEMLPVLKKLKTSFKMSDLRHLSEILESTGHECHRPDLLYYSVALHRSLERMNFDEIRKVIKDTEGFIQKLLMESDEP